MVENNTGRASGMVLFLVIYGLCHALMDVASIYLVMGLVDARDRLVLYIILYNVLAFGLQFIIGHVLDKYSKPKYAAVGGFVCLTLAYLVWTTPMLAVVLTGIGNALFHVAGGKVVLSGEKRKATHAGIYVAPGGIGLALGLYLSMHSVFLNSWMVSAIMFGVCLVLLVTRIPSFPEEKDKRQALTRDGIVTIIVVLLMLSIVVRSVIGLSMDFPWRTHVGLLVVLTLAIALGKSAGGILADRFGWMMTGVGGLIVAAPMLAFGSAIPSMGLAGILIFNFTMPVTLVAISRLLPGRAGFSFGITTLALLIGAVPTFFPYKDWIRHEWVVFSLILVSALALYLGLREMGKITREE